MEYKFLEQVNSPEDLKRLSLREMEQYAFETRALITQTVVKNGGHLASSLGAVEIALALHYVYDAPRDKIIWDVGHQAYAHKIVTGRRELFKDLRSDAGASGFLKTSESEYDCFISGHASTSLSAAHGFCCARKLKGEDYRVAAVIGDGALTGGMAFEALNNIGAGNDKMVVILNDNDMSISQNVGAMNRYFSRLRISRGYLHFKTNVKKVVSAIPLVGKGFLRVLEKGKDVMRAVVKTNKMFEQMGFRYYGPYDGNNIESLVKILKQVSVINAPVIVHVLTKKGSGFKNAEEDPLSYHGLNPVGSFCGESFSKTVGDTLCEMAKKDERVCGITAAMAFGTGLNIFADKFPERCFDVGIAEQHAVTMAAAIAASGLKPYFAVYSSFLQRGYDQVLHDAAIGKLPVTFLIDRAGVVGQDGATHQGTFDLSYLTGIPNLTVLTPKDGDELSKMLFWSLSFHAPLAIRYPKSFTKNYGVCAPLAYGKWEVLSVGTPEKKSIWKKRNAPKYILAAGSRMVELAEQVSGATVVNARSIKPLDIAFLDTAGKEGALLITLEDNMLAGGFGAAVLAYMNQQGYAASGAQTITLGFRDEFIHTHSIEKAFQDNKLTKAHLQKLIDEN